MNQPLQDFAFGPAPRRASVAVRSAVAPAQSTVGGGAPIAVQSMTNTDTADVESTARQVAALARAGSEFVRITVDRDEAAAAVPHIRDRLLAMGLEVPLVGDFHYIGHKLLADHPACAEALDKYRINPGNVGFRQKRDLQFGQIVEIALKNDKPVRIGANWGSLDQELLTALMDDNARAAQPLPARAVTQEAMVQSALLSARAGRGDRAQARPHHPLGQGVGGAGPDRRLSQPRRALRLCAAPRADRGGHGLEGDRRLLGGARRAAAGGDRRHHPRLADARARRRPHARGEGGARDPADHGLPHLCAAGRGLPGCGRTTSTVFQELAQQIESFLAEAMPQWKTRYPGVETLNVAVMGCIVNGPGESKHADIGISLPGTGETPAAPVFVDGVKTVTLRGPTIAAEFKRLVEDYVDKRFGGRGLAAE